MKFKAINNGFKLPSKSRGNTEITGEFFKLNDSKFNALIKATTNDMQKAETAVLRMANDQYRKIIFNAQVYANSGAGTYKQAVDMATRDFLSAGINCIQYKNGRRINIKSYAEMAIRTANKRAYLQGEGAKRKEWGISTVILNKRGNPCPLCLPFVEKVFIDDVWSGGTAEEAKEKGYLLMSECIEKGLYHPNCKDSHSTYFGDILDEDDEEFEDEEFEDSKEEKQEKAQDQPSQSLAKSEPITPKEQKQCEDLYNAEQYQQYAERQAEKWDRMSEFSLDKDNKRKYKSRLDEWKEKAKVWKNEVDKLRKKIEKPKTTKIKPIDKILTTATGVQTSLYSNNSAKDYDNSLEKLADSGIINNRDGSYRAKKYQKNWSKASLKEVLKRFGLDTVTGPNEKGKVTYSSKTSDIVVVYDVNGNYFRVQNKNVDRSKRSAYLDINGENAQNIMVDGRIRGRTKEEFQRDTHFWNIDNDI